jgi:hypothetical protein
MALKRWLSKFFVVAGLLNPVFTQVGRGGTVSSADGDLQYRADYPNGKVTILRPIELEMQVSRVGAGASRVQAPWTRSRRH